jgi:spore coat polysaccharide biosynthesis predicted glycosyltransferase SpsG
MSPSDGPFNEVLVIVGGGDSGQLTHSILERITDVPICVVQGPAGAPIISNREKTRIVVNPAELPKLMSQCAWAVTTGGTSMIEMLFLGKAIHVVPRTTDEKIFAGSFEDQGALLGLGLEALMEPSQERIYSCSRKGHELVDGLGCERIAAEIEDLL